MTTTTFTAHCDSPPSSAAPADDIAHAVHRALVTVDQPAFAARFQEDNEFALIDEFFSPEWVDRTLAQRALDLMPLMHRSVVPGYKRSGSISAFTLRDEAPEFLSLYHSDALRRFLSEIACTELLRCPDDDPHACALYYYTAPGDRVGFHYDSSWYKGARYTVLLGLVQDSDDCRLVCHLHKDDPDRKTRELAVATTPGMLVFFNGDKVWHSVSPLGAGQRRIMLTLEYVTDQRMNGAKRLLSNFKDAFAYFGLSGVRRKRHDGETP